MTSDWMPYRLLNIEYKLSSDWSTFTSFLKRRSSASPVVINTVFRGRNGLQKDFKSTL